MVTATDPNCTAEDRDNPDGLDGVVHDPARISPEVSRCRRCGALIEEDND